MDEKKRAQNQGKFGSWNEQPDGGRIYFYEVSGKMGWKARYVKKVDADENTIEFEQEIFDNNGNLVELHRKFPKDEGHQKAGAK